MKTAFLYCGQGSQKAGMGKDLYETYPQIREFFDTKIADFDIKETCFNNTDGDLNRTRFQQASLGAFGAAITSLLYEHDIVADASAGLSLGEYIALYAAGVFDYETMIDLLAYRGKIMEETTCDIDSKMSAILGLDKELTQKAVLEASEATNKLAVCANYNCPSQIVIGGDAAAVETAEKLCMEFGAKRVVPLNVSGPFHTPLMQKASEMLSKKLEIVNFKPFQIPVIFNVNAKPSTDTKTLTSVLTEQVKSPVLFEQSILSLEKMGIDTVIEIGATSTLSSFVKKTSVGIKTHTVDSAESLGKILKSFGRKT